MKLKKKIKIIGIVIILIVFLYTIFIVEESIRLSNNTLAEPLIIFEESYSGNIGDVAYKSLGFTFKVDYANFSNSNDQVYPISQEFWLFDKFLIWGWIS